MSQRLWLLVEWVDERDVFLSYGIVNVGSLIGNETQLHVGKLIFVRDKHGNNTRRAQILRISDNKRYVKEQKNLMEREDHQVKNVLSICVRTIRDMKTSPMFPGLMGPNQQCQGSSKGSISLPQVVADTDHSSSGSDSETSYGKRQKASITSQNAHYSRASTSSERNRQYFRHQTPNHRSRSMVSSTPTSAISSSHKPLLSFDQATQTDPTQEHKQQIEKMEVVIKSLYSRFLKLVSRIQNENGNGSSSMDMSDATEPNNIEFSEPEHNETRSSPDQNVSNTTGEHLHLNGQPIKGEIISNSQMLQVRRVSAHTTNTGESSYGNDEMVKIGTGNTLVPRRLLNDIDWTSYTTATRQLLQAVFPRRVLATHSLTGKQSPAFMNRPPKKRLDPLVVNDIVDTVAERCGVSKRLARSSITIKCTDESKLYRNRQQYKNRQNQNQENVPPAAPSSDESSTVTD